MLTLKHPLPEVSNDEAYNCFIEHVPTKVRELDDKRKKLYGKLPAKQEDIFEPSIEIEIGLNKFNALCDLGVVFSLSLSLFMIVSILVLLLIVKLN